MSCRLFKTIHNRLSYSVHSKRFTINQINVFFIEFTKHSIKVSCNSILILTGSYILHNPIIIELNCFPRCNDSDFLSFPMRGISKLTNCKNLFSYISFHNHHFRLRCIMSVLHSRSFRRLLAFTVNQCLINANRSDYLLKHIRCNCTRT